MCRKSPILTYPACIWCLRWRWSCLSFADIFDIRKLVRGLLCGVVYVILCLGVLVEHRLVTDRHNYGIYRASRASSSEIRHLQCQVKILFSDYIIIVLFAAIASFWGTLYPRTHSGPYYGSLFCLVPQSLWQTLSQILICPSWCIAFRCWKYPMYGLYWLFWALVTLFYTLLFLCRFWVTS